MTVLLVVLGVVLLLAVGYDLAVTTLAPSSGAGPIARRSGSWLWRLAHTGAPAPTSRRLRFLGTFVLATTLTTWLVMLVSGWWLLLIASDVRTTQGTVASSVERLAFSMTTVSSLGPGYLVPADTPARLVVAAASITGLGLLTLAVTYTLPVATAVTDRRTQAIKISAMGQSASSIADRLRDSDSGQDRVASIADGIQHLAQRHLAYPILHFFHETSRRTAFAPNVAALDEALGLLERDGRTLDPLVIAEFRTAVDDLLDVTEHHLDRHVPDEPPPAVDGAAPSSAAARRRRLAAFVADAGWSWDDHVHGDHDAH